MIAIAVFTCITYSIAQAIDIVDEHKDGPKVITANGLQIVEMPSGWNYVVIEIPTEAKSPKRFTVTPAEFSDAKYKAVLSRLTFGEKITRDEVVSVIDAYYKEVAFDYDSMKIRKLDVGERQYLAWCSNYFITCLDWQFRAGTWVEFEVNGRNRDGGMTGFQSRILMIQKNTRSSDDSTPQEIKPTKTVSIPTSATPSKALEVAQHVLESQGYRLQTVNVAAGRLITTPNVGLLTTKNGDCGRYVGIPNLADKRAVTQTTIVVSVSANSLEVGSVVEGVFHTGYGAADRPLICVSNGVIEQDLLNLMQAQL